LLRKQRKTLGGYFILTHLVDCRLTPATLNDSQDIEDRLWKCGATIGKFVADKTVSSHKTMFSQSLTVTAGLSKLW